MRRERPTIVHTHSPKAGLLGQLAARLAGIPVIINTVHGFYFHEHMNRISRMFYISMEKVAAKCSDGILFQNVEDIETAVRTAICVSGQTVSSGNGIDLGRFSREQCPTREVHNLRDNLGLTESCRVVGFVGRLVREKGILELLGAASLVRKRVPDVVFLIIGPVDEDKEDAINPAVARELGVEDCCIFTGLRQDMPLLYALMDVFVLPSHREGFPRAPMEASAMRVPCVVTDVRGCREAVEQGRNGVLVPLGNVEALATAITDLLHDRQKVLLMGEEGRRIAEQRFDERQVLQRVQEEYRRLLKVKGLSAPTLEHRAAGAGW